MATAASVGSDEEEKLSSFCRKICAKANNLKTDAETKLSSKGVFYIAKSGESYEPTVVFVCVTESKTMNSKLLLREFSKGFYKSVTAGAWSSARAGSLSGQCSSVFASLKKNFGVDKYKEVSDKVNIVKDQMRENIQNQLENMDDLANVEEKAKDMEGEAKNLKDNAIRVKLKMCWEMWKWRIIVICSIAIILTIIISVAVCTTNKDECK